ncbi:Down syndrome cell adhesion molecule-like protein 1 homolog [Myripristis murdjan]|uniref:Down syndrome cell adhesion molecule-like protein 1 homolog n=1 Tax=Myripristis murdjan TaxID=586833 RepID=UPI001175F758|nr:Down syndrome cell adhesion molecule-like protein 1 homolog [Myripristis murdjan]
MIILGSKHLPLGYGLLLCLLQGSVRAQNVKATVGVDVTLSCKYDAQYYGRLAVCWGRGAIPNSGCANQVIKSDGTSVTNRLSERYVLMGDLSKGDVSLTIRQVQEDDSGMYGCRVDIPGWFNDHKHQLTLTVVPAPPNPLRIETREVKERTITVRWTSVFDGGSPITSYRIDFKNKLAPWDTAVTTADIGPDLTQVTLVDMRPAKAYNIRMFAINSVGTSETSNTLTVTTKEAAPGGPPLDVQVEALTSHSIQVTWKPPKTDLRNGVLRSYSLSYREYDPESRQFRRSQHHSVTATRELESVTLHNLKPSTQYSMLIQAKTNGGLGPPSNPVACTTLNEVHTTSTAEMPVTTSIASTWGESTTSFTPVSPDPPMLELLEVKDKMITLHWTAGFDGGNPITGYDLEYKPDNASWDHTNTVADFSSNQTETTIIEMYPSTYNIRVFARNSIGMSEASNVLTVTIEETGRREDTITTSISTQKATFSTTTSADTQAAVSTEESQGGHLAAIVVPVVLVVLIVAIVTTWQFRRMNKRKGSWGIGWLTNGAIHYRDSEPIPEL